MFLCSYEFSSACTPSSHCRAVDTIPSSTDLLGFIFFKFLFVLFFTSEKCLHIHSRWRRKVCFLRSFKWLYLQSTLGLTWTFKYNLLFLPSRWEANANILCNYVYRWDFKLEYSTAERRQYPTQFRPLTAAHPVLMLMRTEKFDAQLTKKTYHK